MSRTCRFPRGERHARKLESTTSSLWPWTISVGTRTSGQPPERSAEPSRVDGEAEVHPGLAGFFSAAIVDLEPPPLLHAESPPR